MDPIFWLGFSILLVAISITAVLVVAVPAFQELNRAARSAEKLFDTLNRELPPTLEAIRLTGLEISELTEDMSQGVQSAGQVAKQVDDSIAGVKQQVQTVQTTGRSVFAGVKAAWRTWNQDSQPESPRDRIQRSNQLPPGQSPQLVDPRQVDRREKREEARSPYQAHIDALPEDYLPEDDEDFLDTELVDAIGEEVTPPPAKQLPTEPRSNRDA